MVPVRVDSMVPHLALFVRKKVTQGEEICFDYGDCDRNDKNEVKKDVSLDSQAQRTRCVCSSDLCSGFLPFDPDLL